MYLAWSASTQEADGSHHAGREFRATGRTRVAPQLRSARSVAEAIA
jgi:hypothetical protein